jgi:Phosphatidylinositol transfer protein
MATGWMSDLARCGVQNPGYMKENFMICIESLHIADTGEQENVRADILDSLPSF